MNIKKVTYFGPGIARGLGLRTNGRRVVSEAVLGPQIMKAHGDYLVIEDVRGSRSAQIGSKVTDDQLKMIGVVRSEAAAPVVETAPVIEEPAVEEPVIEEAPVEEPEIVEEVAVEEPVVEEEPVTALDEALEAVAEETEGVEERLQKMRKPELKALAEMNGLEPASLKADVIAQLMELETINFDIEQ